MPAIPPKTETRIREALKRFQPIVERAKAGDIGEARLLAHLQTPPPAITPETP